MRRRSFQFESATIRWLLVTTLLGLAVTPMGTGEELAPVANNDTQRRVVALRPVSEATTPRRLSNQVSKRGVGSASVLDGSIYVYNVFLSDSRSGWTRAEQQRAKDQLHLAYDFITRRARDHGKSLVFVEEFAADVQLDFRIPLDPHADPRWTEYAIARAAAEPGPKLVERIRSQTRADHVVLCLHVNKRALSYNLAYYEGVADRYAAERMVCFTGYPDGRATSAATYAHEILHLFGAGDLYFPYDESPLRKERAARAFPNDVMYRVDYDLDQLDVGPFTAYRVGWKVELDPKFRTLED